MFKIQKICLLLVVGAFFTGCSMFRVEIQQGNFISSEQVSKLEEGMTKREVRYIMGTPLVVDPFHEKTRWDYVYSYSADLGDDVEKRRVTLFFQEDRLERIVRDMEDMDMESETDVAEVAEETGGTRVTSPTQSDKGFFKRTWDKIFGGDE